MADNTPLKKKQWRKNLVITNILHEHKEQLKNIADNLNTDVSSILKPEIKKLIASYPEKMRMPVPNY